MSEKANVLIVDDEIGPRESLKMVLKPFYTIFTAENGEKAIDLVKNHPIDLVTLDLKMPGLSGTETLVEIKRASEETEVIIITGFGSLKTAIEGIRYGAADYLLKPFDIAELVSIVNRTLSRKKLNVRLKGFIAELAKLVDMHSDFGDIKKALSQNQEFKQKIRGVFERSLNDESVRPDQRPLNLAKSLVEILDRESSVGTHHSHRVAHYSYRIGLELKLPEKQLLDLELGAILHDIGAVCLDRKVLPTSAGARHTEIGSELVAPLGLSPEVTYIVRHHHEHFDGSGSPEGLKGEEIPLLARIVGLAEAFDEIISTSSDRDALSVKEAAQEIKASSGKRFDPRLVETFIRLIEDKNGGLFSHQSASKAVAP